MYKQLRIYKDNQIRNRIEKYRKKGVLFSHKCEKSILKTKIIKDSDVGVRVYLLPNDEPILPHEYINMLIRQLSNDVFPLIHTISRAPFAVLRNTFCYLDHIATLRFGKKYSMGELSKLFRNFGAYPFIQTLYNKYYQDLVQLYRHDLIHSTQPLPKIRKIDKKSNPQVVYWSLSSNLLPELENTLENSNIHEVFEEIFTKMCNERNRKNLCHLRLIKNVIHVNDWCLFFDAVAYLKSYAKNLSTNSGEVKEFLKNYIDNFTYSLFKMVETNPLETEGNKQIIFSG